MRRDVFPFQFGIVREDPHWERTFFADSARILCVASAGDTPLTLAAECPQLEIEVVDPNADQLALVDRKRMAMALDDIGQRKHAFAVGTIVDDKSLATGGAFEALFNTLASFFDHYVFNVDELRNAMKTARSSGAALASVVDVEREMFSCPYWPVAFELAFSDALLHAMFTPAATQHARDPYPNYFQRVFERGLMRDDAATNPWLHYAVFGEFVDDKVAWPPLLKERAREITPFPTHHCEVQSVPSFAPFQGVSLSNVLDWMGPASGEALLQRLGDEFKSGARVLIRQLNSDAPLRSWLGKRFTFDEDLERDFMHNDRSLFYERAVFATRL